jgi:methylglutaconyl-CoA hydratase
MWMHRLLWQRPNNLAQRICHRWNTTEILLKNISLQPNSIISTMTLNRPKANAMGSQMLEEFSSIMDVLEQDSTIRCVVLTSSSFKVFSAGADLKERATMTLDEAEGFVHLLRSTMDRFSKLPMPTICSVEGIAVGGGLELALAADMRIAGRDAVFGLPETSLAIIPGAGGTQRLPRLIGEARAKELIFTARKINSETALAYGLINYMVDSGTAYEKAIE